MVRRHLLILLCLVSVAQAKNWNRDDLLTEQGRIRAEYLSKAGMLPEYKINPDTGVNEPTGNVYHGNCCGEADAYEADDTFIDSDGRLFAVLTCNDPDNCKEVLGEKRCGYDDMTEQEVCTQVGGKVSRPVDSRWLVPADKVLLKYDPVNHTGHGWVYINPSSTGPDGKPMVLCWAAPPLT